MSLRPRRRSKGATVLGGVYFCPAGLPGEQQPCGEVQVVPADRLATWYCRLWVRGGELRFHGPPPHLDLKHFGCTEKLLKRLRLVVACKWRRGHAGASLEEEQSPRASGLGRLSCPLQSCEQSPWVRDAGRVPLMMARRCSGRASFRSVAAALGKRRRQRSGLRTRCRRMPSPTANPPIQSSHRGHGRSRCRRRSSLLTSGLGRLSRPLWPCERLPRGRDAGCYGSYLALTVLFWPRDLGSATTCHYTPSPQATMTAEDQSPRVRALLSLPPPRGCTSGRCGSGVPGNDGLGLFCLAWPQRLSLFSKA